MKHRAGVVVFLALLATGTAVHAFPTGSWTLNYTGTAPAEPPTMVRLTASFLDPKATPIDITFNISGLTNTVAAGKVADQAGRTAAANTININKDGGSNIKQIDGGSNTAGIEVALDGNITTKTVLPGETWKAFFGPGIDSPFATAGGSLALIIPDTNPINLFLPTGTTPTDAAVALANAMMLDGFPDVSLDTAADQVSFLLSPSGAFIDTITEFAFDGANLDLGLQIPTEVPEPCSLAILGFGLLGIMWLHSRREVRG